MKKLKQYFYKGYMRHYYIGACFPNAIQRILIMIIADIFLFSLPTAGLLSVTFVRPELFSYYIVFLASVLYLMALSGIPSIILSIQGYRHREKVGPLGYPADIPRSSANQSQYIAFFTLLLMSLLALLDWYSI